MKKQKIISICMTLFATIVFTLLLQSNSKGTANQLESPIVTPTSTPPSHEEQIAREFFSQKSGIPVEDVYVGVPAIITYTVTLKSVWEASVGDQAGNRMEIVTVDRSTQEVIDGRITYEAEQKARIEKYGKLDPALYERLQTLSDDELVQISIWFSGVDVDQLRAEISAKYPDAKLIDSRPSNETDLKLYEQIYKEMVDVEINAYRSQGVPIVDEVEKAGGKILYSSQRAPLIFAEVSKKTVYLIAAMEQAESLSLNSTVELHMNNIVSTDRANAVWSRGFSGSGIRVAVVEPDAIDFGHPNLEGSFLDPANMYNPGQINLAPGHATNVAGVIASTHATHKGIAYSAGLYSANSNSSLDSSLIAATEGAISADARVINLSFGSEAFPVNPLAINDLSKYYDHVVRYDLRTVVASVGNDIIWYTTNPGIAYNVIGVGGIEDYDTINWSDDTIWDDFSFIPPVSAGSSYGNPADGREKPEVVAVAKDVYTTDLNNGFGSKTGTSMAAPQVSGMAALLMSRNGALKYWPEAVKAIIMASAVHNVDGGAALVSDKDGVGSVNMLLGDTIVQNGWWVGDSIAASTSEKNYYISVNAGEKVRVVLSYLSHTSNAAPYNTDQIKSNLDLKVYTAGNQQIGVSTRTADNWEIAEFTAVDTGSYRIRVYRGPLGPSNTNDNESLAVAWYRMRTHLPDIRSQNGWSSKVYVRNDDSQPTTAFVTFLNSNGTVNGLPVGQNIAASGVYQFTPPANWSGNAVVDGSEDLSVVVTQERSSSYTHESYAGVANPATDVRVPLVHRNNSGWYSELFIQNTGNFGTSATTVFIPAPNYGSTMTFTWNIEVGGRVQFDTVSLNIGNGSGVFVGSVRITAGQPLAVASTQYKDSGGVSQMMESSSTEKAVTVAYAPLIQNNNSGWTSGLTLSRTGGGTFDVRYYRGDTGAECTNQLVLGNNPQTILPAPPAGNPCPLTPLAKLQVSSGGMVAAVNQLQGTINATTYTAIAAPARTAIVAKVRRDNGWSDGIVIGNFNNVTANVTVWLYNDTGSLNSIPFNNYQLGANRNLVVLGQIPVAFNGSAVITADQPVAVMANSSFPAGGSNKDTIGSYPANHR